MTNFRITFNNLENAFATMLANSKYNHWYELFDRESFEEEFAKFVGKTESALWKSKTFIKWYHEMAEEL